MAAQAELSIAEGMEHRQVVLGHCATHQGGHQYHASCVEWKQGSTVKSLVSKLAEACASVGFVEKKGHNLKQNYPYLRATDVAAAIRNEFFSRSIILVCDEKDYRQIRTIKTNSGGEMCEFLLHCEYTFMDGASGEKLGPFGAFGAAMDSGDKALNKAKTSALKYVIRGIGLIPDESTDPEADEKVDEFVSRPHTSTPAKDSLAVEFDQRFPAPSDYDDSQLLDAPPKPPHAPGSCKACGGKVIPAGVSKKTGKPYNAFCKDCKQPQ